MPNKGKDLRLGEIGIRMDFSPADCLMPCTLERNAVPSTRNAA